MHADSVGRCVQALSLFVYLFVRSISKRMNPKYSNLVCGMTLGYPRSEMVLEFQGHKLGLRYSNTAWVLTPRVPSGLFIYLLTMHCIKTTVFFCSSNSSRDYVIYLMEWRTSKKLSIYRKDDYDLTATNTAPTKVLRYQNICSFHISECDSEVTTRAVIY